MFVEVVLLYHSRYLFTVLNGCFWLSVVSVGEQKKVVPRFVMAEGNAPCVEHTLGNGSVLKTCAEDSNTCGQAARGTPETAAADTRDSSECDPRPVPSYKPDGEEGEGESRGVALDQEEELVRSLSKVNASGVDATKDDVGTPALLASIEEKGSKRGDHHQCVADGKEESTSLDGFSTATASKSVPQRSYSSRSFTFGKSQKKNRHPPLSKAKPPSPPKYRGSILRRKSKYV